MVRPGRIVSAIIDHQRRQNNSRLNSNSNSNNNSNKSKKKINKEKAKGNKNPSYVESQILEEGAWCEIKEIVAERGNRYKVVWAGEDPATGQPWKPEWKGEGEVTEDAIKEWEWKTKKRRYKPNSEDGRQSRRRKDNLPSSTQSSEYVPSQELSILDLPRGWNLLTDGIGVEIEELQGLDRDQYTAYTTSDIEGDDSELGSEECVLRGSFENGPPRKKSSQGLSEDLPSQRAVVESLDKELSSQGPSSKVILVYEKTAIIPDSQSLVSTPSNRSRTLLELFSSQEHRVLETQAGVESQELEEVQTPSQSPTRLLEDLQVSGDWRDSTNIARLPSANEQANVQIQGQPDEQLGILSSPEQRVVDTSSINSRENSSVSLAITSPLESSFPFGQGLPKATPGIKPQVLATEHIHKPLKSAAASSDRSSTASLTRGQSLKASFLGTETSTREHLGNRPIEAFRSLFADRRREATKSRSSAARATTPETKQSRGRSSTLPISLLEAGSFEGIYSRHSLPPSMRTMSSNNVVTSPQAVSSIAALRERLARNREERNAKVATARNARNTVSMSPRPASSLMPLSRSPSTVPAEHTTPSPAAVTPANLLNLGVEKAQHHSMLAVSRGLPQTIPSPTKSEEIPRTPVSMVSENVTQTPFGLPYLGPAEYVIGLPLRTKSVTPNGIHQKKAYLNSIVGKHLEIQRFLSNPNAADTALIKIMQEIIETSGRIATHPDLPFDKVGISAAAAGKEAEYHAAMSSKFVFLKAFLGAVKGLFLKIVIVAEEGKLIDILEIFLRGLKVCYSRLDRLSTLPRIQDNDLEGLVKVFLLPSCKSGAVTNAADCLIAMDSTFNAELPEIKGFRSNIVEVEKLAPVIRLVAINTIEHLRLCRVPGQEIPLHVYIETLKNLRLQVGIASQEYGSAISRAPTKISKWLQKKADGALDIPNIPELPLFESATQLSSTTATQVEGNDKRKRQEDNSGTQIAGFSVSLPLETKRLRVHDPEPGSIFSVLSQQQGDITHISDSMSSQVSIELSKKLESEPGPELVSSPMDLENEEEEKNENEEERIFSETERVAFVQPTIIPEETDMESMSREDLVCTLKKKMNELRQWMDSTGRLQVRHEELRRTLLEVKRDLKKSQKTQKDAETRKERILNELTKMKTEKSQLQTDIEQARNSLLAGPPGTAHLEQLRAENEELKEKLRAAENSAQTKERDFDFLRDQYQQASNGAFELQRDNDGLRKEILVLEKRSDEVVVRLRQSQLGNQVKARDKLIESLSLQLKEREERILRLEHERAVNTRSRGSLGMRASSVSIRGSPIQSRATSPATGAGFHGRESLTHPLRNG